MTFHFSLQLDPHTFQNQSPARLFIPHHPSGMQAVGWWRLLCYTLPLRGVLRFAFCPGAAHPIYTLVDRFGTHR